MTEQEPGGKSSFDDVQARAVARHGEEELVRRASVATARDRRAGWPQLIGRSLRDVVLSGAHPTSPYVAPSRGATISSQSPDPKPLVDAIRGPSPRYKRDEVNDILAHPEQTAPHLLAILAEVARDPAQAAEKANDFDAIYALYLLTELRDTRAHDDIVRIAQAPVATVHAILGEDFVTNSLAAVLLATAGERTDGFRELFGDERLDAFVRGAAAVALAVAVHRGHADRDEVLTLLVDELTRDETPDPYTSGELIRAMLRLHPVEHHDLLRRLVAERELDVPVDLDAHLARGPSTDDTAPYGVDRDVHAWMSWWQCFEPRPPAPASQLVKRPRNGPCWCGSGRKYKGCHYKGDLVLSRLPRLGTVLSEIAEPLLEWSGIELRNVRLALQLAASAWNAERGLEPPDPSESLSDHAEEATSHILPMLRRRAARWGDDPRVVASVEVDPRPDGYVIHVTSSLPTET